MTVLTRYILVDRQDNEGTREYANLEDAIKDAGDDHAVIEREYEYSDQELVWTPDGSNTWPPAKITCDKCQLCSINGVVCHETGCPNQGAKWEDGEWVRYRECFYCGYDVRQGDECNCMEPIEDEDDNG